MYAFISLTVIFLLFVLTSATGFLNLKELVFHKEKYIKENNYFVFTFRCIVSIIMGIGAAALAFYNGILLLCVLNQLLK